MPFVVLRVCYERASLSPTIQTFVLSAIWHGVYPGYYLTFLTGVVMTLAARAVSSESFPSYLSGGLPELGQKPSQGLTRPAPASAPAGSEACARRAGPVRRGPHTGRSRGVCVVVTERLRGAEAELKRKISG